MTDGTNVLRLDTTQDGSKGNETPLSACRTGSVLASEGGAALPRVFKKAVHRPIKTVMLEDESSELGVADDRVVEGNHAALAVEKR
jgi:hypothetical protein